MNKALLAFLFCLATSISADDQQKKYVSDIAKSLIEKCFTDLDITHIEIETLNEEAVFFDTNVSITSILNPFSNKTYVLRYNPKLFINPPSKTALTAILSHELNHIRDYKQISVLELVKLGLNYLLSSGFRAHYERATDEKSLSLGFAKGLIEYRNWLYQNISTQDVELKKINYWTPEQIKAWSVDHAPQQDCSKDFLL